MREIVGTFEPGMKFADLHMHTNLSHDTHKKGMGPTEMVEMAALTGLSAVAITDHHNVKAADFARNYAARRNLSVEIVMGVEINTKSGHVLGLFVENPIGIKQNAEDAIEEIRKQGGLVVIPHPIIGGMLRSEPIGLMPGVISRLIEEGQKIDGYEVYSAGAADIGVGRRKEEGNDSNTFAKKFYEEELENFAAPLASTDGHGLTIGRAVTAYSGDIRSAILSRSTVPMVPSSEERDKIFESMYKFFGRDRVEKSMSRLRSIVITRRLRERGLEI